ncbi:Late transcription factor VLTF-4 (1), partial [Monkeypox virus]
VIIPSTKPKT